MLEHRQMIIQQPIFQTFQQTDGFVTQDFILPSGLFYIHTQAQAHTCRYTQSSLRALILIVGAFFYFFSSSLIVCAWSQIRIAKMWKHLKPRNEDFQAWKFVCIFIHRSVVMSIDLPKKKHNLLDDKYF